MPIVGGDGINSTGWGDLGCLKLGQNSHSTREVNDGEITQQTSHHRHELSSEDRAWTPAATLVGRSSSSSPCTAHPET